MSLYNFLKRSESWKKQQFNSYNNWLNGKCINLQTDALIDGLEAEERWERHLFK